MEHYSLSMAGVLGWYRKMKFRPKNERNGNSLPDMLNPFDYTEDVGYFLRVTNIGHPDRSIVSFEEFYPSPILGIRDREIPNDLVKMIKRLDSLTLFQPVEVKVDELTPQDQYLNIEMKLNDGKPIFVKYEKLPESSEVYGKILKALAVSKK